MYTHDNLDELKGSKLRENTWSHKCSVCLTFSKGKTAEMKSDLVVNRGQGKRLGCGQVQTQKGSHRDFFGSEGTILYRDHGGRCLDR